MLVYKIRRWDYNKCLIIGPEAGALILKIKSNLQNGWVSEEGLLQKLNENSEEQWLTLNIPQKLIS